MSIGHPNPNMKNLNFNKLNERFNFGGVRTLEGIIDPESWIHELVHLYDVIKDDAFKDIGSYSQNDINNLINSKYIQNAAKDRSEIRVSAITFLIMQRIGNANITQIIYDMRSNLIVRYDLNIDRIKFLDAVADAKNIATANKILKFIEEQSNNG